MDGRARLSVWLVSCSFIHGNNSFNDYFRRIAYYSAASTPESAFVIGGSNGTDSYDVIAQFHNDSWSLYGNLRKRRFLQGSITSGTEAMVIGGATTDGL